MSFPVPGTLMIEPTESESKAEIDRFCDSLIAIYGEIIKYSKIEDERLSPLKGAPHTFYDIVNKNFSYSISEAFPAQFLEENVSRYIAPIGRVNNVFGDRNFVCSCVPIEDYMVG